MLAAEEALSTRLPGCKSFGDRGVTSHARLLSCKANNAAQDQKPTGHLQWRSWYRNQLKAPGEAGHEVMRGVGIGKALPPPPPMPKGHTAVVSQPNLTEKQLKKLLKAQKKEAKHAKKAAKKVWTWFNYLLTSSFQAIRASMHLVSSHWNNPCCAAFQQHFANRYRRISRKSRSITSSRCLWKPARSREFKAVLHFPLQLCVSHLRLH